jgi:CheY-like chemotaxis protein
MNIAILEPDLEALDRTLETLSSSGHLCFATVSDEGLRRMLDEVSVELFLIDWTDPDADRYETLRHLAQYESGTPIVLCVAPHTPQSIIDSGMQRGASLVVATPLRSVESLGHLHNLSNSSFPSAFAAGSRLM